jgi:outer membrane immunogenic protein
MKAPPVVAVAVFSWTGFYIGGNVGGARGNSRTTLTGVPPFGPPFFSPVPADEAASFAGGSPNLHSTGVIGGVQVGYNFMVSPNILLGLEADWDWQDLSASNTTRVLNGGIPRDFVTSSNTRQLATVRPRIGIAFDRLLVYGTGGLAMSERSVFESVTYNNGTTILTGSQTHWSTGWTAGGGFEYAFDMHWTAKAEYLHVDLGTTTTPLIVGRTVGFNSASRFVEDLGRLGINYKF